MPEQKEPTRYEYQAIERLAVLGCTINRDGECLKERLRSVPDLYRQYRIAQTAVSKIVDGVYKTLPDNVKRRMLRESENCEFILRPVSVMSTRSTDSKVMLDTDILTLVNSAMIARCSICIKNGREVKSCDLRKALMNVVTLDEPDNTSLCGYARIASGLDKWEDND